jgi:hypothetical protein
MELQTDPSASAATASRSIIGALDPLGQPCREVSSTRLALRNALPSVEKRKKVGERAALIDQLWSAIELLPDPEPQPDPEASLEAGRGDCNAV